MHKEGVLLWKPSVLLQKNCENSQRYTYQNGACVKDDPCADYPLTSCDFPGAAYCSKCPSDSSKMKLEVCAPTYDYYAPHFDERWITYWIKTEDGTCPAGAICAPENVTLYTKSEDGTTCIPNEHNNKIIGCKNCYRKANNGPECVYHESYCSGMCHIIESNNGPACQLIYGTTNRNSSSWVTFSPSSPEWDNSEAHNQYNSYCEAITDKETCSSKWILKWYDRVRPVTLPYSIDPNLIGVYSTKACCEWSGPSS